MGSIPLCYKRGDKLGFGRFVCGDAMLIGKQDELAFAHMPEHIIRERFSSRLPLLTECSVALAMASLDTSITNKSGPTDN